VIRRRKAAGVTTRAKGAYIVTLKHASAVDISCRVTVGNREQVGTEAALELLQDLP